MQWLLFFTISTLILIPLILLFASPFYKSRERKREHASKKTENQNSLPEKLNRTERFEMLENVRNIAQNDPERTARLIKKWIKEDESSGRL